MKEEEVAIRLALKELHEGKGIPHKQVMKETQKRFSEYFKKKLR